MKILSLVKQEVLAIRYSKAIQKTLPVDELILRPDEQPEK